MKKTVVIALMVVAVIIAINLVIASKAYNKNKYHFIKESPHLNDYLFNIDFHGKQPPVFITNR